MIRGKTISYASAKAKKKRDREHYLEEKIEKLQKEKNRQEQIITDFENELRAIREGKIRGAILRAKSKWKIEGDKSTKYFCNLEKRHYNEKLIFHIQLFAEFYSLHCKDRNI